jgi:hypothetical protein
MIVIQAIKEEGFIRPERQLTEEEKINITSTLSNGVEYIYYEGDEPEMTNEEEIND